MLITHNFVPAKPVEDIRVMGLFTLSLERLLLLYKEFGMAFQNYEVQLGTNSWGLYRWRMKLAQLVGMWADVPILSRHFK
jgi:hypothetical protein